MSEQLIGELTTILQKQRELYDQLLGIAKDKKDVLVKADLAALDGYTRQEEKVVLQVGKLEDQRNQVHQALANHFNVQGNEVTIAFLLEKCGAEPGASLSEEATGLKTVLDALRDVNDLNSDLVKQSLDYIEYTVNLLTSMGEVPSYPEKKGASSQEQVRARLFDKRI